MQERAASNSNRTSNPVSDAETIKQPKQSKATQRNQVKKQEELVTARLCKQFTLVPVVRTKNSKEEPDEIPARSVERHETRERKS